MLQRIRCLAPSLLKVNQLSLSSVKLVRWNGSNSGPDQENAAPEILDETKAEFEKLIAEKDGIIKSKDDLIADFKDKYIRSIAENENMRNRSTKLVADAKQYGIQGFSKDLLDIADTLDKAIESVSDEQLKGNKEFHDLFKGLEMTASQLQKVFNNHGIEKINPVGEKFDPNFHEALFQQPFPGKEPGSVAVVTKVGYLLHQRPLRAALVGVVKG